MAIIRAPKPTGNFTVIRNEVLRDTRLSYKARGLLAAILSRPDNWRTDAVSLAREGKEGRDAVRAGLTELEENGYLKRFTEQNDKGQWQSHCLVFDTPMPDDWKPVIGEPAIGEPDDGEPVPIKKTDKKNREKSISLAVASEGGITAREVAGSWVDAYREAHSENPPSQSIKRVAQSAKQLLQEGVGGELLCEAAKDAATGGHANLVSAVTFLKAKGRKQRPRGFSGIEEFLNT